MLNTKNLKRELDRLVPIKYHDLLKDYLNGKNVEIVTKDFDVVTKDLTPFTRLVLKNVCRISFGHTITYGELAQMLGNPKAVRAVASALGRNPLPVIIPCHRVVAASSLGGYTFGIEIKRALLDFELSAGI